MKTLIVLMLMGINAYGFDWACNGVRSEKREHGFYVCASGSSVDESMALTHVFYVARKEFKLLCNWGSCYNPAKEHIAINPLRSECEHGKHAFRGWPGVMCYRAFEFNIVQN